MVSTTKDLFDHVIVDMAIGIFFYFPSMDCRDVMYRSVTMKKFRYLLCLDFPISLIFCVWRCHGDLSCVKISHIGEASAHSES
jgi:hypothetical protein